MLIAYPRSRFLSASPNDAYAALHHLGSITPGRERYTPWEVV